MKNYTDLKIQFASQNASFHQTMAELLSKSIVWKKKVVRGCSRAGTQMRARYASVSSRAGSYTRTHATCAHMITTRNVFIRMTRAHNPAPRLILTYAHACVRAYMRACEFGHARVSDIRCIYTIRSVHPAPSCYATGRYWYGDPKGYGV